MGRIVASIIFKNTFRKFFPILAALPFTFSLLSCGSSTTKAAAPQLMLSYDKSAVVSLLVSRQFQLDNGYYETVDGYYWQKALTQWLKRELSGFRLDEKGEWISGRDSLLELVKSFDSRLSITGNYEDFSDVDEILESRLKSILNNLVTYSLGPGAALSGTRLAGTLVLTRDSKGDVSYPLKITVMRNGSATLSQIVAAVNRCFDLARSADNLSGLFAVALGLIDSASASWSDTLPTNLTVAEKTGMVKEILKGFASLELPGYANNYENTKKIIDDWFYGGPNPFSIEYSAVKKLSWSVETDYLRTNQYSDEVKKGQTIKSKLTVSFT